MNDNLKNLLSIILDCDESDLELLKSFKYDLRAYIKELRRDEWFPVLDDIASGIFCSGQEELAQEVEKAIDKRKNKLKSTDVFSQEYGYLLKELNELEALNPFKDMDWCCDYRDSRSISAIKCWLQNNEDIYRKYLSSEIKSIENRMGFKLGGKNYEH